MTASHDQLEKIKVNQLGEIKRLRAVEGRNGDLLEEVKEANQKNKELHFRISRLQKELEESGRQEQAGS